MYIIPKILLQVVLYNGFLQIYKFRSIFRQLGAKEYILRGTLHYNHWVKRTLDKLSLKRQGRSPLKYTNYGVCISVEKKFVHLRKVWVSINIVDKLCSTEQTLGAKTYKKCHHVGILEVVFLYLLTFNVKPTRSNFCSLPIKLLESFVLLTSSVKRPSATTKQCFFYWRNFARLSCVGSQRLV
jgi:hypothetical protein